MSRIEISVPDTLLYHLKAIAMEEGVSLEQYVLFALTRQAMLVPAIPKVSEKDAEFQHQDFTERMKRLGHASSEDLEKLLEEREPVEPESQSKPETVLRLKNRIAEAKNASR